MAENDKLTDKLDILVKFAGLCGSVSVLVSIIYDWGFYHALGLSFTEVPTTLADHARSSLEWLPLISSVIFAVIVWDLIDVGCLQRFERGAALYPQPHGKIFDFEKTAEGAEWIDDFARRACAREDREGVPALRHADWRVEHLRFQDGKIVATYDWDSLAFTPETKLVGISAHGFAADWSLPNVRRIPSGADIRAYIDDYAQRRGRSFSRQERQSVFVSCVYQIAYGARCQHSLHPDTKEWEQDTWPHLLRTEGEILLTT
jgi:hypothetical protein